MARRRLTAGRFVVLAALAGIIGGIAFEFTRRAVEGTGMPRRMGY